MKTIKELADDLGVSKTAVMKKIDNLGLREKLAKNGNRLAIFFITAVVERPRAKPSPSHPHLRPRQGKGRWAG